MSLSLNQVVSSVDIVDFASVMYNYKRGAMKHHAIQTNTPLCSYKAQRQGGSRAHYSSRNNTHHADNQYLCKNDSGNREDTGFDMIQEAFRGTTVIFDTTGIAWGIEPLDQLRVLSSADTLICGMERFTKGLCRRRELNPHGVASGGF